MKTLSNDKINFIYHLADIHIPISVDRKVEYEKVFDELYDQLSKEEKGVIVICGDIYDSKSSMNPISVELFHRLMRIHKLMPLIVISGNHDGSTVNNQLKDSIFASSFKYEKNFYYLNETGLYKYGDIIFSAKHFFDDKPLIKADQIKAENDEMKIALYHGALHGAKFDNGMEIEGEETLNMSTFDGFDMVLLGDIHKYQTFKNESMAYSSSLIQQNYGEPLKNHGYIKWYMNEPKMEFKRVKNDYGFVTIRIVDGKYEKKEYPKNIRLRIFYKNTTKEQLDKIIIDLSLKHNIIDDPEPIEEKDYSSITNMEVLLNKKELYDKMIDKYIQINTIDADIKDEVKAKLHESIQVVKEVALKKYEIKVLEISNIFCFGEGNIIDFRNYENLIGLFSKNFSGKSSIIDCISEVLYDTNSKGLKNDELIRNGQKTGTIKMLISLNGIDYEITKKYSSNGTKVSLIEKATNKNLNDDDNGKTIKKIEAMFPNRNYFTEIHCMLQGDNNGFVNDSPTETMKYLIKVLGINDTENLKKTYSTKIHTLENSLLQKEGYKRKYQYSDNRMKIIKEEIINIEEDIEIIEDNVDKLNKERFDIKMNEVREINHDTFINQHELQKEKIIKDINKIKIDEKNIKLIELDDNILTKYKEKNDINNQQRNIIFQKINKLGIDKHKITSYNDNLYDQKDEINKDINSIENKINNLEKKIKIIIDINLDDINIIQDKIILINDIKNKNERLKKLSLCRYNDNCDVCVDNNKEIIIEKNKLIEELKNLHCDETYENLIENKNKLSTQIKTNMIIENDNLKINKEIINLEKSKNIKYSELDKIDKMIDEYENNKQKIIDNKKIDLEINLLNEKIIAIDSEKNIEYEQYIQNKQLNNKNILLKEDYRKKITTYEKNVELIEIEIKKIKDEKILYEKNKIKIDKYYTIDKEIHKLNNDLKIKKKNLDMLQDELKLNINNKKENLFFTNLIENENRELKIAKVLEIAYDHKGFTKLIINEIIPNMEKAISRITGAVCGYTVEIDKDLTVYMKRSFKKYRIQAGSGSEKLLINIAFRLMMVEYGLAVCKTSMMLIDESFVSFDSDKKLLLPLIIQEILKRYDKVLIISHMEELKNMVKKTIKIKKINDVSKIY